MSQLTTLGDYPQSSIQDKVVKNNKKRQGRNGVKNSQNTRASHNRKRHLRSNQKHGSRGSMHTSPNGKTSNLELYEDEGFRGTNSSQKR